jgi:hypothetical protein
MLLSAVPLLSALGALSAGRDAAIGARSAL